MCKVIFILCGSYTPRAVSPTPHRADGYWDADDRRMYFNTSSSRLYVSDYPYSKEAVEFDPKLGVHETFEIVGRYIFVQKTDNGMVALYVSDRRGLFDKAHIPIPGGHERYVCPCICDSNCTLQSAYLICLILHNRVGVTVVLYVCVCVCVCVHACVRARARTCVTINFTLQSVHLTQEDVQSYVALPNYVLVYVQNKHVFYSIMTTLCMFCCTYYAHNYAPGGTQELPCVCQDCVLCVHGFRLHCALCVFWIAVCLTCYVVCVFHQSPCYCISPPHCDNVLTVTNPAGTWCPT